MISLSRLNGAVFALNDQLVERVEANPDTVIVLVDGKKFIVSESVEQVVEQIRQARADAAYRASLIQVSELATPELRLVTDDQPGSAQIKSINPHDPTTITTITTDHSQEGSSPWIP